MSVNILLISEEADCLEELQNSLADSSYFHLEQSISMEDFRNAFGKKKYDALFIDLKIFKEYKGKQIQEFMENYPTLPVIGILHEDNPDLGRELIQAGAQDYLVKTDCNSQVLKKSIICAIERQEKANKCRFSVKFLNANLSYFKHLIQFNQHINKKLNLNSVFQVLKTKIQALYFAQFYSLFLMDKVNKELRLVSHNHPEWQDMLAGYSVKMGDSIMWDTIRQQKIINISEFSKSKYSQNKPKRYKDDKAICIPITIEKNILGVLNLNELLVSRLTEDILIKMQTVSHQLAMTINNTILHNKIEELSITDDLSGLYNRRYLGFQLANELKRVKSYKSPLSLMLIDIDTFKDVNDSYGHKIGDLLIKQLADNIKSCIRKIDIPGRYGGEEFLILLPNLDKSGAEEIGEKIRTMTESQALKVSDEQSAGITVSIGIAEFSEAHEDPGDLMKCADQALHEAKLKGKNRVEVYYENMKGEQNPNFIVKTYFIEPLESISIIIDTLIKMEFETYSITKKDRLKLLKVLEPGVRNVIFICVAGQPEIAEWVKFIETVLKTEGLSIQIGAFIYDRMDMDTRMLFLEKGVAAIQLSEVLENTLAGIKKILTIFEARGKRKHIRANAYGKAEAFFKVTFQDLPLASEILNISVYSFACRINMDFVDYFNVGGFFNDVLLSIRGTRIQISARVLGFDKENPEVCLFQIYNRVTQKDAALASGNLSSDTKNKLYNYIRFCLRENIKERLESYKEKEP